MSEYEILDLANQAENQVTAILQWWGGVSFGLLALGHFAAKKLNTSLVILVVVLYVSFSVMSAVRLSLNLQEYAGYFRDLTVLQENGISLSPSTIQRIESGAQISWYAQLTFGIVLFGTFLGSICYFGYANFRERKSGA